MIQWTSSSSFCGRPLWAVLAWAGMPTLWRCPSSISAADHGIAHPPRCPEGWFQRGSHCMWHAWAMQISVSWQLPEEILVSPQGRWSCSAPSCWSCNPSRCVTVSSGTWFQKPGPFSQSQHTECLFHSYRAGRRWQETCTTWTCLWSRCCFSARSCFKLATSAIAEAILMQISAGAILVQGCSQVLDTSHLL